MDNVIIKSTNISRLPEFVCTFGVPGSGKSEYIRKHNPNKLVVSTDSIRKEIFGSFNQSRNDLVWSRAIGRIEGSLLVKKGVILDATNTNKDEWIPMVSNLPLSYKIAWVINTHAVVAFARIQRDIFNGRDRANVPKDFIDKAYNMLQETIKVLPNYFDKIIIVEN